MCKILIRAENHWAESVDRSGWDAGKLAAYAARIIRGDAIVVMPDDHIWGNEEGPPKFVIVKVPDMSVEEAKEYMKPLEGEPIIDGKRKRRNLLKSRCFSIPNTLVQNILDQGGVKTITKSAIKAALKDRHGN